MFRSLIAVVVIVSLTALTANAGPVGWWKLDGDGSDSGSSGTDGVANGVITYVDVSGDVAGLGSAADLTDGGNADGQNYFDLGAADGALNPGAGAITVAAWGKLTGNPGGEWGGVASMFGFGDCCGSAAQRSALELALDNNPSRAIFAVDTRGSGAGESEAIQNFDNVQGNWHHLVGVKRADGSGTVYINGGTTGVKDFDDADLGAFSVGTHAASANTQNRVNIGRNPFGAIPKGDRSFNGLIGDVQVYHEALTEAQALQLFNNPGTAIPEPSTFLLSLLAMSAAFGFRRIR